MGYLITPPAAVAFPVAEFWILCVNCAELAGKYHAPLLSAQVPSLALRLGELIGTLSRLCLRGRINALWNLQHVSVDSGQQQDCLVQLLLHEPNYRTPERGA